MEPTIETKHCSRCGHEKPLTDFYKNPVNITHQGKGRHSWCKACFKERGWARDLLKSYGLTPEQYDALLVAQGGRCAICSATEPGHGSEHFPVDHDHVTGRVRGLLCHNCNKVLTEHLEKNIEKVVTYLKDPPVVI